MTFDLAQADADYLLALDKERCSDAEVAYPSQGGKLTIPLQSTDESESFILDLYRSTIDLTKNTHQTRARNIVILARLDLAERPHRNPDGALLSGPHLHLYASLLDHSQHLSVAKITE